MVALPNLKSLMMVDDMRYRFSPQVLPMHWVIEGTEQSYGQWAAEQVAKAQQTSVPASSEASL